MSVAANESSTLCPAGAVISPTERLFVPHQKRLSFEYTTNEDGNRELRIDYGMKEITFDEQHLFAFGEQLVRTRSFTGELATAWGPGYTWDELRPLLEALIDEGIVQRGEGVDDPRGGGLVPSRVPPSTCPEPRCWSLAECEAITRDLGGRAVEVGYLEAVVPVFRIAHPALDGDDRQVGEANVYPGRLRLDREGEWRVCQYSGSRYRDDSPMNVTALRAMIKHWKPMMATILDVRRELGRRLAIDRPQWTIGELFVLSSVVLGLPAFQLLRRGGSSPQRPLHPVMSSLFRITDGIRMTTNDMLFAIEYTRQADEQLTAAVLYTFVEQHGGFLGTSGVCAGPKPLIDEFLAAVIDGIPVEGAAERELPAEVRALLAELPVAIDYGLYAMQAWATSLSVWLAMSQCYQAVIGALEAAGEIGEPAARLLARLRTDWKFLAAMQITLDYDRDVHAKAYAVGYEIAQRALPSPAGAAMLADEITPGPAGPSHRAAADQLGAALAARFAASTGDLADRIAVSMVDYLRAEQASLTATARILDAINQLLDRPRPKRSLSVRDYHVNYVMAGGGFPYLLKSLEDELGIRVDCTVSTIDISDRAIS